jgi:hypothetical protein
LESFLLCVIVCVKFWEFGHCLDQHPTLQPEINILFQVILPKGRDDGKYVFVAKRKCCFFSWKVIILFYRKLAAIALEKKLAENKNTEASAKVEQVV